MSLLRARHLSLRPREREVLPLIVSGLLNKHAAAEREISLVTLQIHRGNIMRKLEAASLSDLVRMSTTLGIPIRDRHTAAAPAAGTGPQGGETHADSRGK